MVVGAAARIWSAGCALALVAACASNNPDADGRMDSGVAESGASGSGAAGGAAGSAGSTGGSAGSTGGAPNSPDASDAALPPDDSGFDVHGSCDAAALPRDLDAGTMTPACLACMRAECPCEILAGGDPQVVACVADCVERAAATPVPSLVVTWCRQGYMPEIPPRIGNPTGTPAQDICGGPAVVTAPANLALRACASSCPCP